MSDEQHRRPTTIEEQEHRNKVVDRTLIFIRAATLARAKALDLDSDLLDDIIDAWSDFFIGTDDHDESLLEIALRDAVEAAAVGREWRP
jgi:hypothetical protein